jgi:hypothetical protein
MNLPDMPVQVPVDDPNADTEWYVQFSPSQPLVVLWISFSKERYIAEAWCHPRKASITDADDPGSLGGG